LFDGGKLRAGKKELLAGRIAADLISVLLILGFGNEPSRMLPETLVELTDGFFLIDDLRVPEAVKIGSDGLGHCCRDGTEAEEK
jgi:hypothetical protein